MTDSVQQSFGTFASTLDKEVRILKCITNFRSAASSSSSSSSSVLSTTLVDKLFEIEAAVNRLEHNISDYDSFLDSELQGLEKCNSLSKQAADQATAISVLLQESAAVSASASATAAIIKGAGSKKKTVTMVVPDPEPKNVEEPASFTTPITSLQFESVPKSTRGRLALADLNSCLEVLSDLLAAKNASMTQLRKKMSKVQREAHDLYTTQRVTDHGDACFVTETEIRNSAFFDCGEASGKAALHSLRALKRIRMVRSGAESTYLACL